MDTHSYGKQQRVPSKEDRGREQPSGKGKRFVIRHCGGKTTKFLSECELVLRATLVDSGCYIEMNDRIIGKWVRDKLVPAPPPASSTVMDHASYHGVQGEGTKLPTTAARKADMQRWMTGNFIAFNPRFTQTRLYELVEQRNAIMNVNTKWTLCFKNTGIN